ncbi:uncharacterized protein ARMOST_17982 [Armillaria ostoyae]|uniref:HNH nuclease domain-containing protein n=1 Tax=Armillaria ostoyae TaxID=47428 RepID=A0A284S0H4_ARMOS|nr:uncharacterized protein ARMOST_17982 [Armillaria ostoyae]
MAGSVHLYVPLYGPDNAQDHAAFWLPCLEIPIDRLADFSLKPYRWLCYAGHCIMGVEGSLSFSPTDLGGTDFDYDAPFESTLTCGLYFHPRGAIFPIDPDFEDGSSTAHSENEASAFRTSMVERDGTCVVTDDPPLHCDAVYLIRHNKGSEYIERFTQRRGGDVITDIDDPRNGLLVNTSLQCDFSHSVAILPTPNFIMTTSDVVPRTAPDDARWTVHDFAEPTARTAHLRAGILAGHAVRTPSTSQRGTWPPHCLFAAVYASALITTWPVEEFSTQVRSMWTDTFYPGGRKAISDPQKTERKKKVEKSELVNEQGDDFDVFDVLLMLREMGAYNMARKPISQPSSAQKTHEDARERVLPWLQSLHDSNTSSEHL